METRRQTAVRTRVSDITNSKFIRKEGFEPSYVITDLGLKISRAKIMGTIIDKFISENGTFSSITVVDDTGSVRVKAFQEDIEIFDTLELGETVTVIGRVKEYNEENYLTPEVIKKISDPNYETLHKLEILKGVLNQRLVVEMVEKEKGKFSDLEELKNYLIKEYSIPQYSIEGVLESLKTIEPVNNKNYKESIVEVIKKLDNGKGVEIRKLMIECKLPDDIFGEVVSDMLNDGICYESSPGIIRLA